MRGQVPRYAVDFRSRIVSSKLQTCLVSFWRRACDSRPLRFRIPPTRALSGLSQEVMSSQGGGGGGGGGQGGQQGELPTLRPRSSILHEPSLS